MTQKKLSEKLEKLGYTLERTTSGWIIKGSGLTYNWHVSTLKEVQSFVREEESVQSLVVGK
jgi:hypothetical protein